MECKGKEIFPKSSFFNTDTIPEGATPVINNDHYYPSHNAVDFYNRYQENIDLLAELGINIYRLSISRSRIFPDGEESEPNEEGLKFYDKIIKKLVEYDIEPMITICHDDMPVELALKYNGWTSREVIEAYVKYATVLFERYGDYCKYWITFNEINAVRGFGATGIREVWSG